jgi:hypothetical protein
MIIFPAQHTGKQHELAFEVHDGAELLACIYATDYGVRIISKRFTEHPGIPANSRVDFDFDAPGSICVDLRSNDFLMSQFRLK